MSENLSDYLSAVLEVRFDGETWIGTPDTTSSEDIQKNLPLFLTRPSIVITAWNPNGRFHSELENRILGQVLLEQVQLSGFEVLPCIGRDPIYSHFEEGLLVPLHGDAGREAILKLAIQFQQEAVFDLIGNERGLVSLTGSNRVLRQRLLWTKA